MECVLRELGRWAWAAREALTCLGLSMTNLHHAGLWWRSALLSLVTVHLWLFLYYYFSEFFLSLTGRVALVSFLGLLSAAGVSLPAGSASISGMASIPGAMIQAVPTLFQIVQLALTALAIAAAMYVLLFIFAVHSTMSISCRRLLLKRIRGVVVCRYATPPAHASTRTSSTWQVRLKRIAKLLVLLCIPVVSLAIVLRFLLTWNLHWLDHAVAEGTPLPPAQKRVMVLLGLSLGIIMLLPVLNLMLPAMLCSCVCHLRFRSAQFSPSNEAQAVLRA